MTAQSEILLGKRLRAFVKRGQGPLCRSDKWSQERDSDLFLPPSGKTEFSGPLLPSRTGRPIGLLLARLDANAKRFNQVSLPRLDRNFIKRLFDVGFSLLILILFSPVYLILALLIALGSPGPIFYVQERVGKNHEPFGCIKFRTMVINADEMLLELMETSPQLRQEFEDNFKLKQDPRITKIGRFLRLTSLDEFPQFWNVLKGDMSVVGPRPLVVEELPRYGCYIDKILTIKPGITGLWQVSGRNDIPYDRRVQIDLYYAKFHNFWLDLWVIVKTIGVVVVPKNNGAY